MLEVVMHALFKTQPLNEMQVGLGVLHTVFARFVGRLQRETVGIAENAVLFEQGFDDLLRGLVLKNALIGTVFQVGQTWHQRQAIVREALARAASDDLINLPVDTAPKVIKGQKSRGVQQRFKVQICAITHKLNVKGKGRVERFVTAESQHLNGMRTTVDVQPERVVASKCGHP